MELQLSPVYKQVVQDTCDSSTKEKRENRGEKDLAK